MASTRTFIEGLLAAARAVATIIPGTTDDTVVDAAGKLADLIEGLTSSAPDTRTQVQMQTERAALAAAVKAKAVRTAARFD